MHKQAIKEILLVLQKHKVPLQHGVALICRARGDQLGALANRCGFHRNSLYKALAGEIVANPKLVAAVRHELGVNPWDFASHLMDSNKTDTRGTE
jgi:DNA-binding phage protein